MRKVKFRAWDKVDKMMKPVRAIKWTPRGKIDDVITDDFNRRDSADCIVMQYTGMKDRHGKEIYEGDIVNSRTSGCNGLLTSDCYGKVGWSEDHASWELDFFSPTSLGKTWMTPPFNEDGSWLDYEVIGNVYETKIKS